MTELKRCPFCGNEPQLLEGAKRVFCGNPLCGMGGSMDLKFWNTRPIEDELNAELKNAKELLEMAMGEADKLNAKIKELEHVMGLDLEGWETK
jgi:hypothetical protein